MMRSAISPRLAISSRRIIASGTQRGFRFSEKCPQALLTFGRHALRGDGFGRDGHVRVAGERPHTSDQRLRRRDCRSATRSGTSSTYRCNGCSSSWRGDDGVDETDLLRPGGREPHAGQEQLARRRRTDLGEDVWRDDRGQNAEFGLGESKHRGVVGDGDVADRGQPGTAAERGAVNAADDGRGKRSSARNISAIRRASRRLSSRE